MWAPAEVPAHQQWLRICRNIDTLDQVIILNKTTHAININNIYFICIGHLKLTFVFNVFFANLKLNPVQPECTQKLHFSIAQPNHSISFSSPLSSCFSQTLHFFPCSFGSGTFRSLSSSRWTVLFTFSFSIQLTYNRYNGFGVITHILWLAQIMIGWALSWVTQSLSSGFTLSCFNPIRSSVELANGS